MSVCVRVLNSLSHSLPLLVFGILNNLTSSLALLVSMYWIVCLILSLYWYLCIEQSVVFSHPTGVRVLNSLSCCLTLRVSVFRVVNGLSVLSPFTRVWVPCSKLSVFFQTLFCVCNQISIICLVLSALYCWVHIPSAISLQPVSVRVPYA
jgi:hypothetical protein